MMGMAFIARENSENYSWILTQLREMNSGIEPRTVITDFDIPMCSAIEKVYIRSNHFLSQWHMLQHLRKHFTYLAKRKSSTSKLLYNHIIDAIYCDVPKRFIEL